MLRHIFKLLFLGILIIGACKKEVKTPYTVMESRELAKGIRNDSLFLGFYLGMAAKNFYDRCWELNKMRVIKEGPGNLSAVYIIDTPEMKMKTYMDFYPKFHEGKIYYMPVRFQYIAWNPINPEAQSPTLQMDVLQLIEKWYGKGFIKINDTTKGRVFVKVEGNRRISITTEQDKDVWVKFVDLSVVKKAAPDFWVNEW